VIRLKTAKEIATIRRAGRILAELFRHLQERVAPGVTTADLDRWAEAFIRAHEGAEPAFKGLYGFPATLCVSINEEVVHGIPSERRRLREGDIVSLDCGVRYQGLYADAAVTLPVGAVTPEVARLLRVTREALAAGIAAAQPGRRVSDIGAAVEAVARAHGYGVVRDLVGHGVGHAPHEDPQVPNYFDPTQRDRLRPGMVLAIEPMLTLGTHRIRVLADRWTVVTEDRSWAAHFEHTVAITPQGPRVLTDADSCPEIAESVSL
jgi:methionyl aminopeptidase